MGTIQEIRGNQKYLINAEDHMILRDYLAQATREEDYVPSGCQTQYARLLELLNVPWGRIQTLFSMQSSDAFQQAYDPHSDYFIIPETWGTESTGSYDPPWNQPDIMPIARAHPGAVAVPVDQRSNMDEALALFKEIRTGACAKGTNPLIIGTGIMAVAGLGWFLWSKWRS